MRPDGYSCNSAPAAVSFREREVGAVDRKVILSIAAALSGLGCASCSHVGAAGGDSGPAGDTDGDSDTGPEDTEAALCGESACGDVTLSGGELIGGAEGCTHVEGDLYVTDTTTAQLQALQGIRCVDGDLHIHSNPALENLDGLSSLVRIGGGLHIGALDSYENPVLSSLAGLGGVDSAVAELVVINDPSLESLDGLYGIDGITTGRLDVRYDDALLDVDGLSAMWHTGDSLLIRNNGCLPEEEAESVADALVAGGFAGLVSVGDNGESCD
jgi:hypothetical protein